MNENYTYLFKQFLRLSFLFGIFFLLSSSNTPKEEKLNKGKLNEEIQRVEGILAYLENSEKNNTEEKLEERWRKIDKIDLQYKEDNFFPASYPFPYPISYKEYSLSSGEVTVNFDPHTEDPASTDKSRLIRKTFMLFDNIRLVGKEAFNFYLKILKKKDISSLEGDLKKCKNAFDSFKYQLDTFNSFYAQLDKRLFSPFNMDELDYINKLDESNYKKRVEKEINTYLSSKKISNLLEIKNYEYFSLNDDIDPEKPDLRLVLKAQERTDNTLEKKEEDFKIMLERIHGGFTDFVSIVRGMAPSNLSGLDAAEKKEFKQKKIEEINYFIDHCYASFYTIQKILNEEKKIPALTNKGLNSNHSEWNSKVDPKGLLKTIQEIMNINLFLPSPPSSKK